MTADDEAGRLRQRNAALETVLREITGLFTVYATSGAARRRTRWVPDETVERWMAIMAPRSGDAAALRDPVPAAVQGIRARYGTDEEASDD